MQTALTSAVAIALEKSFSGGRAGRTSMEGASQLQSQLRQEISLIIVPPRLGVDLTRKTRI